MAVGPIQLVALGFAHPNFEARIMAEVQRLRDTDTVRVIDALAVYKDADGEIEVEHLTNLSREEAIEAGSPIGALIGLCIAGEENAEICAQVQAANDEVHASGGEEAWDVIDDIPNDSAAALLLLEHHWAVPLRDAVARAGGYRISDGFISPYDLLAVGVIAADEVDELPERQAASI